MSGPRWPFAVAALALVLGALVAWRAAVQREAGPPSTTAPTQPPPETQPPETTEPAAPPPPARVAFSWRAAGAFVWHETDVDPALLGRALRENGFGWVAVRLHDGLTEDPVDADWVSRFRVASGLPVGGWGVLRTDPEGEARLAERLLDRYDLDFYIANAEAEYAFSGPEGTDGERSGRSRRFVRALAASLPASFPRGLSSYCAPGQHDLDWAAWAGAGYAFLPQAYVNDFDGMADPATCVASARAFFPVGRIHPTIGVYAGQSGIVPLGTYVDLLTAAGTVGFSVYLAETRMTDDDWHELGAAIRASGIAVAVS